MSRYIDADALKDDLVHNRCFCPAIVDSAIRNTPTADVVEVRHGEWREVNETYPRYVCTVCNHLFNNKNYNYCPICKKKPKVKYSIIPTGVFCKVICKPLFRREHLSVECGQAGEICDRAEKRAFEEWNRRSDGT